MTMRRFILVALAVLIAVSIKKALSQRESEWHGLTEDDVRSKLDAKLPSRIPDSKRSEISDKIVAKMRDKGVIGDEPVTEGDLSQQAETIDLSENAQESATFSQN